jgi:uncharacterized protein (TIGR00299 family) protein
MLAYFDCFSGISGDMTLGALIDLGVPLELLKNHLRSIPIGDFDITATPVHRNGIHAMAVVVEAYDDKTSRNFAEIRSLIENCQLPEAVKSSSLQIFQKLAASEAQIHSCSLEEVHFHETGGIDAIADIVGTAIGLDYLGIEQIFASRIPLGRGFVSCTHGTLPVPAPATLSILEGIPVYGTDISHELVTPTGAAIVATFARQFGAMPDMTMTGIGYGAGRREFDARPNLLRIITGARVETAAELPAEMQEDHISIIEACIDDMNPELFGYLMDRLFEDGALDVYWVPVFMKKNRPGTMLQVLCETGIRETIIRRILSETTTLGVRYSESRRRLLWRDRLEIKTTYGDITVKRIKDPGGNLRVVPEYEECKKIAREHKIPLRSVYDTIIRETGEWK